MKLLLALFFYIKFNFERGLVFMFLKVFDTIIYDEKIDLESCKKNQYLRDHLTDYEMSIVVPLMYGLLSSRNFDEFLDMSFRTSDYLQERFPITDNDIVKFRTKEFSLFERYSLTFFIVSDYLKILRYRAKLSEKSE